MTLRTRQRLLLLIVIVMIIVTAFVPRFAQDPAYHNFADQRAFFSIPNFFDVTSNLPFLFVGIWGLWMVGRRHFLDPVERWPYVVFFIGIILTCFGSAYYHWEPNNRTLVWDRLPMTLAFMGLLSALIAERIDLRLGIRLLVPLTIVGLASVAYWEYTETVGRGDLRPYVLVQFGSLVLLLLLLTCPPRYTGGRFVLAALALYGLAKIFELLDVQFLRLIGISGHTLKHLASAVAIIWIVEMLRTRKPVHKTAAAEPTVAA